MNIEFDEFFQIWCDSIDDDSRKTFQEGLVQLCKKQQQEEFILPPKSIIRKVFSTCEICSFGLATKLKAIAILSKFMNSSSSNLKWDDPKIQMIINSSILLSCKLNETKDSALQMLSDLKLSSNERAILFRFEQDMLNKIKFRVNIMTPCDMLEWVVRCYAICFSKNKSDQFNAILGKKLSDNQILDVSQSILFLLYGNDLALDALFGQSDSEQQISTIFRINFFSISIAIVCCSVCLVAISTHSLEEAKISSSFIFDWASILISSSLNQSQIHVGLFGQTLKQSIVLFCKKILSWTKLLNENPKKEEEMNQLFDFQLQL